MKNFINKIRSGYYLKLGEYAFSPLLESSLGISLQYIDTFKSEKTLSPLFVCFPEKGAAALWMSIGLLRHYFFEDYIFQATNRITELGIKHGDYVEIFGCCVQYINCEDKIKLRFRDVNVTASKTIIPYINTTTKSRLNNVNLFRDKKRDLFKNRNAISKILEPSADSIINSKSLNAQVLLITGRGNTNYLRNEFRNTKVYGESLSQIFSENVNLIIRTDLDEYKDVFSHTKRNDVYNFRDIFEEIYLSISDSGDEIVKELNVLRDYVSQGTFLTKEFSQLLDEILDDSVTEEYPFLNLLKEAYPGIETCIPENLKVVLINDISLINLYQSTIDGFLQTNIPVVVISDRFITENEELGFYANLFKARSDVKRLNWNKKKIISLCSIEEPSEFIDKSLWESALRYASQEIVIKVCESTPLDVILPQIQSLIRGLEGFELLKKSYYCYFQPAAYIIKNSQSGYDLINGLVDEFEDEFNKVRTLLIPDYKELIEDSINILRQTTHNSKAYSLNDNIFSAQLALPDGNKICLPADVIQENKYCLKTPNLLFTGFPLNEFLNKHLLNAVCLDFIPEVKVLCWPNESELTYQYLRKRILAGYFVDNIPESWGIPSELLLSKALDFQLEMDKLLKFEQLEVQISEDFINQEKDLFEILAFRYNGFQKDGNRSISYRVNCKIIDFEDNSFMFLPLNSKVLAQLEPEDGQIRFKNASFNELKKGFRIYKYGKNRADQRTLAKSVPSLESAFDELEDWRNCLLQLYYDSGKDLNFLESYLSEIKEKENLPGSPTRQNIQRWIFDDEMHSPEEQNLILIYKASTKGYNDEKIKDILEAKKKITSFNRRIDKEVKEAISNRLSQVGFADQPVLTLNIYGVNVQVESKVISGLQNSNIETDYYNTRKFLI